YSFKIPNSIYVDATKSGNLFRFANHSCEPNCDVWLMMDGGCPRLMLVANGNINKGDAISFDY
ncbi:hypothetical protein EDB81DRAFT_605576, partial [Dactylonectria macrodidyma]